MPDWLRRLILVLIARPVARFVIGMDVYGQERLPASGPAIVAANHNSHIDTLLLLCLFPSRTLHLVRPAAAADHFLASPLSAWFSRNIVRIVPVDRRAPNRDVLAGCRDALAAGSILVIFPEGTRGAAEKMGEFKSGVARLAEAFPDAPVVPVYIQGSGRVLPRGSRLLVPFVCSAIIGEPIAWSGARKDFMARLRTAIEDLRADAPPLRWL